MKSSTQMYKEILSLSYQALIHKKEPPLTPRFLKPLKPLINKGYIEPVNIQIAGRVYLRFTITALGILYLFNLEALWPDRMPGK